MGAHIPEEELELYAVSRDLPEGRLAAIEEHLLICEVCQERLRELDEYIAAMRKGLTANQWAPLLGSCSPSHQFISSSGIAKAGIRLPQTLRLSG
jgi:hypothetical protein